VKQIDADYYYNAVPTAAKRDVKSALRVRRAIVHLAARHQFVEARGGEYFFVPSITALRMIGMGVVDPT
jgi:hypothetical protein